MTLTETFIIIMVYFPRFCIVEHASFPKAAGLILSVYSIYYDRVWIRYLIYVYLIWAGYNPVCQTTLRHVFCIPHLTRPVCSSVCCEHAVCASRLPGPLSRARSNSVALVPGSSARRADSVVGRRSRASLASGAASISASANRRSSHAGRHQSRPPSRSTCRSLPLLSLSLSNGGRE